MRTEFKILGHQHYQVIVKYYNLSNLVERVTDLKIGKTYLIVSPLYSKQKYLENRICILEDFIKNKYGLIEKLKVRYLDTNRVGRVSISNVKEYVNT